MKRYKSRKVNGKTYLEHRLVVEQAIGRKLVRGEHVHHKNGNTFDNQIENLEILSPSQHMKLHKQKHPLRKVCPVCGLTYQPRPTKRAISRTCGKSECFRALIGRSHRKVPVEQIPLIVSMRAAGTTLAALAAKYGVTKQAIAIICKKQSPQFARAIVRENVVKLGVLDESREAVPA